MITTGGERAKVSPSFTSTDEEISGDRPHGISHGWDGLLLCFYGIYVCFV